MIITAILSILYEAVYFLTYPVRILQSVSVNSDLLSNISLISSYFESVSVFFPVNILLIVIGLEVGIETGIFAYKFIMWVIKRLPTQS